MRHNNDTAMLDRLTDERSFMTTLLDRARSQPTYRTSDDFQHHVDNLEDTFFFPLNWLADGHPDALCRELGHDYQVLSRGTPTQKLALRIQLLDDLLGTQSTTVAPKHEYDVFISHASEDKKTLVSQLAEELRDLQLQVWYDEFELVAGDSLRRSIDHGIARSRCGLVILSPAFFKKNWTQYELDGLVSCHVNGGQKIIPVWFNVGYEDILRFSPSLADKVAIDTSGLGIQDIALKVNRAVRGYGKRS
jgi:hypothetical protein